MADLMKFSAAKVAFYKVSEDDIKVHSRPSAYHAIHLSSHVSWEFLMTNIGDVNWRQRAGSQGEIEEHQLVTKIDAL